jgi:hypothetical protein
LGNPHQSSIATCIAADAVEEEEEEEEALRVCCSKEPLFLEDSDLSDEGEVVPAGLLIPPILLLVAELSEEDHSATAPLVLVEVEAAATT